MLNPLFKAGWRKVATGSITAGSGKFDLTAANAFAEFGVDIQTAYGDEKCILAAYNTATGFGAFGWISGTAPGGETLSGVELVTNGTFATVTTGWDALGSAVLSVDTARLKVLNGAAAVGSATQTYAVTQGALYKSSCDGTAGDAGQRISLDSASFAYTGGYYATDADMTNLYRTAITSAMYWRLMVNSTTINQYTFYDNVTQQRVTDCATTGALILSTRGGSRGWAYKHASYNPNLASVFKVFFVGD